MNGTGPAPARGRMQWMDLLRGVAILLVMTLHISLVQQVWDGPAPHGAVLVSEAAAPFRMPILLFASGILLPRALAKPTPRFLAGKARSLLWPWLLWSFVMLPLAGWQMAKDPYWWSNGMYTWFLLALFVYYVIGLVTQKINPAWIAVASVALWTLLPPIGVHLDPYIYRPDKFLLYAVFFFAGAALRKPLTSRNVPLPVLVPATVVALGWAAYAVWLDRAPLTPVISQIAMLIGVVAAIGIAQRLPRFWLVRGLEWIGRNSVVAYLVHLPIAELLARYLALPAGSVGFAISFTVTLGVCLLAIRLRPWTSFLYAFPSLDGARVPQRAREAAAAATAPGLGAAMADDAAKVPAGAPAAVPAAPVDASAPAQDASPYAR
ncbi:acyltransferase family protein [Brachybacterium sp. GCM10030252]|uniref:acyltransferase family protein n=1 Tax=Brachybacterium sp. GCM10030252 TaxID=3273380 RepID=UPI00360E7DC1